MSVPSWYREFMQRSAKGKTESYGEVEKSSSDFSQSNSTCPSNDIKSKYTGIEQLLKIEASKSKDNYKSQIPYSPKKNTKTLPATPIVTDAQLEATNIEPELEGGVLEANSIGSNVIICWKGREIERLHFAAVFVPWSRVCRLREEAMKGRKEGGYMFIDLDKVRASDGTVLFREDFISLFGVVFTNHFVPMIHEQFNSKGDAIFSFPDDISVLFKLLVLSERLQAKLKQEVYHNMCRAIKEDVHMQNPSNSASFKLIRVSLDFEKSLGKDPLQKRVILAAVNELVDNIPKSYPALESLINECTLKQSSKMAVLLFHETTMKASCKGIEIEKQQWNKTKAFMEELKASLQETRSTNHIDLFTKYLGNCHNKVSNTLTTANIAQTGAGFNQGIVLEKMVQGVSQGDRVVRCHGNVFEWKKPGRKGFIGSEKFIKRENIVSVKVEKNDSSGRTFRVLTNKYGFLIDFRAHDARSCEVCVTALHYWLGRLAFVGKNETCKVDEAYSSETEKGQQPNCPQSSNSLGKANGSSGLIPPPPPLHRRVSWRLKNPFIL